jgi:hypothetical protein
MASREPAAHAYDDGTIDVFEALADKLGVDRREAKRLILNAVYSEDARYKRTDNLPAGHDLFGIAMSHDQLEAAIGAAAVATIEEANFVLVPKQWRDREFTASDRSAAAAAGKDQT